MSDPDSDKPVKLIFKSYLAAIDNSVGSNTFRNFYVSTSQQGEFDALEDGVLACAFFVSGLLKMFGKAKNAHGTVASTVKDLEESDWQSADEPKPGDVLVWEKAEVDGDLVDHIGFFVGNGRAVSNSYKARTPIEHDMNFKDTQPRQIIKVLRMENWEDGQS